MLSYAILAFFSILFPQSEDCSNKKLKTRAEDFLGFCKCMPFLHTIWHILRISAYKISWLIHPQG